MKACLLIKVRTVSLEERVVLLPEAVSCVFWEVFCKKWKYLSSINPWCTFNKTRTISAKSERLPFSVNCVFRGARQVSCQAPERAPERCVLNLFQRCRFFQEHHMEECLFSCTTVLLKAVVKCHSTPRDSHREGGGFHNRNCAIRLASPRRIIKMWMINAGHVSCPARCREIT